jgi:hypothetical protein
MNRMWGVPGVTTHREQHVGALHHQQHQEQGRGHEPPRFPHEEAVAGGLAGNRDEAAKEADHRVLARLVVAAAKGQLDAGVDQERPEEPHHPLVPLHQFRPQQDEGEPHDHRPEDAPEEDTVLVLERHAEVREHHREHEHVVHRQRPFDEVAREKLDRRLAAQPPPHQAVEGQGQGRPEAGPEGALPQRRLVRLAVEDGQIEDEHHGHEDREGQPMDHLDRRAGGEIGEEKQRAACGEG